MDLRLTAADRIEIEKSLCEESLSEFVQLSWHWLEPDQPYVHGWHVDAMGDHLEAVAKGEITRLLINIPPGTMKSSMVSVFFPAWLWGPFNKPSTRFIGASYEQSLAIRDNRRTRLLVEGEWYQDRWPIQITSDQNEKSGFENVNRGFRQSCAVKSMTGKRGDVVVWDDPLSPEKAYSEVDRETANRVFAETLPTRLNNPDRSAIVIVMQRLHEDDVSGHILANDLGYEHLMLPMEFEPERKCKTKIGFEDPRTKDGELLFPERFPPEVVERDKKVMGSFATAGQFQQRPVPRGGALFQESWFEFVDAAPAGIKVVRAWDLAATEDPDAAFTAGVKIGQDKDGFFYVLDSRRIQGTPHAVEKFLRNTASLDGMKVEGSIPKDPGQAGKMQAQYLIRALAPYRYRATPESGDKIERAAPFAAQAEAGNVRIVRGDWNKMYLDELCSFPFGKFADQVDATSRAFDMLTNARKPAISRNYRFGHAPS